MKIFVILALVGLSVAAPAVDNPSSNIKPGHSYPLPTGSVPVASNIQPVPLTNQNLPLNNLNNLNNLAPNSQILPAKLIKNEGQPIDTPLLNNSPQFTQSPLSQGYPWLYLQQNPQLLPLYHLWMQQQFNMFNYYNLAMFQQWLSQNQLPLNQFNQPQLPINQNLLGQLPLNQDLLSGRANPITGQPNLLAWPNMLASTTRYVSPIRTNNLIGTSYNYKPIQPINTGIRHQIYPYEYGLHPYYQPYQQYPFLGGYQPYGYQYQNFQSYPYYGLGGSNLILDVNTPNTLANTVQPDQLNQNQPIVSQPPNVV